MKTDLIRSQGSGAIIILNASYLIFSLETNDDVSRYNSSRMRDSPRRKEQ